MKNAIFALVLALLLFGCTSQTADMEEPVVPVEESEDVPETEEPAEVPDEPAETQNDSTVPEGTVSAAELSMHNLEADCWVVYKGEVYDVTAFLPNHADGDSSGIVPHCGLSGVFFENAFEGQHGTEKVDGLMNQAVHVGTLEG